MLHTTTQGGTLNIVMECAGDGDLSHVIQRRQRDKKPFSEDEIMLWWGWWGRMGTGMGMGDPWGTCTPPF